MASNKKVTLEVAVKTQEEQVDALEQKVEKLKQQKLQMKFEADTQALDAASQKLKDAENKLASLKAARVDIDVNDAEIEEAEREVERLKQEQINLQLQVEEYKLDELQSKKDAIEADEINVQLNNQSAMQGLQQIADGFSRIKSSAMEVGQQFGDLLASAGKQETNFKFLENAVGNAETARQKMQEINDIVAQLPGDDTALQGLLSSAAAKDSSLTAENLKSMANSATDYFSAMSYYGKSATEAQQDMTNYLLAGNTAELERSPILQGHIDKLKEATTVQERSKALAEALNEEHWGGMGAMDTYNNKLETFNGMIERGRYTLGGMFQEGAKDAMDFLLKLDESTNGLVGMGIAAASFASPITDMVIGIGQIGTGLKSLNDAAGIIGLKDKFKSLKDHAKSAAETIKTSFSDAWTSVKNAFGEDGAIRNAFNNIKAHATSAADSIKHAFTNAWKRIKEIDFGAIKQKLSDLASSALKTAKAIGTTLFNALKSAATAAKDAALWIGRTSKELLTSAANALRSAAAWVWEKTVKVASTIATRAAAAAQAFLNLVMSMNPIMLVVIAIVALIAILWYLYNTCEPVRNAIDGMWEGITSAIQPIIDSVQWLIDKLTALANGDWTVTIEIIKAGVDSAVGTTMDLANNDVSRGIVSMLLGPDALAQVDEAMPAFQEKLTTSINDMLTSIWDNGTWGFLDWLTNLSGIDVGSYLSGMQSSFASIPEWVNQAGQGAIQGFQGMFAGISGWLNSIITNVVSFGGRLVNSITTAARNAWTSFVNNIKGMWKHMAEEVDAILREARRLLEQLPSMLWNAAVNMVRGWLTGSGEGSPGFMYYAFEEDLGAMQDIAESNKLATIMGNTASNMVRSWGNPNLSYSIEGTIESNGDMNSFDISEILRLLNELVSAMKGGDNKGNISNTFVLQGDMDSEDRMRKFLDAVIREMEWDNNKAGRTIDNGGYI